MFHSTHTYSFRFTRCVSSFQRQPSFANSGKVMRRRKMKEKLSEPSQKNYRIEMCIELRDCSRACTLIPFGFAYRLQYFFFISGLKYFQILNTTHKYTHSRKKTIDFSSENYPDCKHFFFFYFFSFRLRCDGKAHNENAKLSRVVFCWHSTAYVNIEIDDMHTNRNKKKFCHKPFCARI